MEAANRLISAALKAADNNTVINVFLIGAFVALGARSSYQQRQLDALEAEKASLVSSNKSMKKSMWDWKQQLFAEASAGSSSIPLARLQAIYGYSPAPQPTGNARVFFMMSIVVGNRIALPLQREEFNL
ncbi:unnamed protein product [Linum tenue]|uniref:ATP synthase protein MI25 n=1 Tax=Linum tenue TaxID=586396 RepID=A0AAV0IDJ1_9ROSI|nr:unnamed protein product [Linum tenue]